MHVALAAIFFTERPGRGDGDYRPAILDLADRARELQERTRRDAESLQSDRSRATLLELARRQEQMETQLRAALPVLARQQEWARQRIPLLETQRTVAMRAYETVELAVDFAATLGGVSAAFEQIGTEMPELIVFDVPVMVLREPEAEQD